MSRTVRSRAPPASAQPIAAADHDRSGGEAAPLLLGHGDRGHRADPRRIECAGPLRHVDAGDRDPVRSELEELGAASMHKP